MKKYLCITIASLLTLIACDKEARVQEEVSEIEPAAEKLVTITASIPVDGLNTKVSITEADNGEGKMRLTKLSWEEGDEIIVNTKSFTVKPGSISGDGLTATFQGKDPGSGPYNITYTNVPGDPNNQEQPADGDPSDVGYSVSLTGADTYEGATFSSAWASSHGATFAQSSVLQLRALLPAAVAAGVKKVIFKSTANIFNGSNTLTVTLTSAGTTGTDNKLDVYAMLPAGDITLAADMDLLVQFEMDGGNEYDKYTAFRHFASGTKFVQSGCTKYMGLDCSNIDKYANASAAGVGGSSNHILIGDQNQMSWLASKIASGNYIDLVDDIDMTGVASSLNPSGAVTFNGNSKTISNTTAPLFDDLKGTVSNFTISNAVITSAETVGILANTCNTAASTVSGVTVTGGALDYSPSASGGFIGGLVGEVSTASSFDDCHLFDTDIELKVSKESYIGGAFGYVHNAGASIGHTQKCTLDAGCSVSSGNYAAGFISKLEGGSIEKNEVACVVKGSNTVGGLIAYVVSGTVTGNVVSGTVTGISRTGGLIGVMDNGTITSCSFSGDVNGEGGLYFAGLIGIMNAGRVEYCYSTGNVNSEASGWAHYGGLIAQMNAGIVTKCHSSCSINYKGHVAGGLIGDLKTGTVEKSYATGVVGKKDNTQATRAGGLIGLILANSSTGSIEISNCYSTGAMYGYRWSAAFIGATESNSATINITNCYTSSEMTFSNAAIGTIIGTNGTTTASVSVTGFIAWSVISNLIGSGNAITTSAANYYGGKEGTILSYAQGFGWNFLTIWNEVNPPTLR